LSPLLIPVVQFKKSKNRCAQRPAIGGEVPGITVARPIVSTSAGTYAKLRAVGYKCHCGDFIQTTNDREKSATKDKP
jgi:hypothetical protein